MKKTSLIICMLGIICVLSGCSDTTRYDSDTSSTVQTADSSSPVISEENTPSDEPENASDGSQEAVSNEITALFETPAGDKPDFSNAVTDNKEIDVSDITNDNWNYVICHDYVYLAEPLGISYNSGDDTEHYNTESKSFINIPETVEHEFKRYNVNDSLGGLTIKDCYTVFHSYLSEQSPKYYGGGSVSFDGTLTMTGVCCVTPETVGYEYGGDIQFIPDSDSCLLPIMYYGETEPILHGGSDGISWCSEYTMPLNLGNISEISNTELPTDGSYVRVRITVSDVTMRNDADLTWLNTASLTDIEII